MDINNPLEHSSSSKQVDIARRRNNMLTPIRLSDILRKNKMIAGNLGNLLGTGTADIPGKISAGQQNRYSQGQGTPPFSGNFHHKIILSRSIRNNLRQMLCSAAAPWQICLERDRKPLAIFPG